MLHYWSGHDYYSSDIECGYNCPYDFESDYGYSEYGYEDDLCGWDGSHDD